MSLLEIASAGVTVEINSNESLLDAIRKADGIRFESPCNGRGTCGKCKVILRSGDLIPLTASEKKKLTAEEEAGGVRLACCAYVAEGCDKVVIDFPDKEEKAVVLADADYHKTVKDPLFSVKGEKGYGIAVDIGTTTVAAVLLDLTNGETIARTSSVNPQTVIGGDVLSRIAYTISDSTGTEKCQKLIVECLNTMTDEMLAKTGVDVRDLKGYVIAANCTMLHLLLNVDPSSLARAPFKPVFTAGQFKMASDIGLCPQNPEAQLYCLPSVSAYIGADITAGIYMSEIYKTDKNIMFIDIGTNGEIVLSRAGALYACSCAAGPALEGMNISCGMRAAEGAIERVAFKGDHLEVGVIGDAEPKGICGSGVLETLSALLRSGAVNRAGKISKKSRIPESYFEIEEEGKRERGYYIYRGKEDISFSQGDIRQIQLAKGAILSGFESLIQRSGLTFDDLDEVIIAGQFGSHLKAETLTDVGILPVETLDKVRYIGNSSLSGAISVFLDKSLADLYEELSKNVDYVELGTMEGYNELFLECLTFPDIAEKE
ncbi:MAG: ASKHA domain-containing protein [Lachnospiraceae bacterium]|nr:ASKHA domain-containing protein [Lachnospiraceae bacterium]